MVKIYSIFYRCRLLNSDHEGVFFSTKCPETNRAAQKGNSINDKNVKSNIPEPEIASHFASSQNGSSIPSFGQGIRMLQS